MYNKVKSSTYFLVVIIYKVVERRAQCLVEQGENKAAEAEFGEKWQDCSKTIEKLRVVLTLLYRASPQPRGGGGAEREGERQVQDRR